MRAVVSGTARQLVTKAEIRQYFMLVLGPLPDEYCPSSMSTKEAYELSFQLNMENEFFLSCQELELKRGWNPEVRTLPSKSSKRKGLMCVSMLGHPLLGQRSMSKEQKMIYKFYLAELNQLRTDAKARWAKEKVKIQEEKERIKQEKARIKQEMAAGIR